MTVRVDQHDGHLHVTGNHGGDGGAADAEGGSTQTAEDQHPVQEKIGHDGTDAGDHGDDRLSALPQRAGVGLHKGKGHLAPEHNRQIGTALPQRQLQIAAVAFALEKAADKAFAEEGIDRDAGQGAEQAENQLQPEGLAHAVHIALAIKLRAVNTDAAQPAENREHEHHQHGIGDGGRRNGLRSQPPHHNIIQQGDEIGNELLDHDGNQQGNNRPVKGTGSDVTLQQGKKPPESDSSLLYRKSRQSQGTAPFSGGFGIRNRALQRPGSGV